MENGNWIPLDKNLVGTLPHNRAYSYIEAMFSYTVDQDNSKAGTINGYAKQWGWSRNKVRKFINELRTVKGHIADRKGTGRGHHIRFINNNLQVVKDMKGTYSGQEADRKGDTTIYPKPKPDPKPKKTPITSESVDSSVWDNEELWLKVLIENQIIFTAPQKIKLLEHSWWVDVDQVVSGITEEFIKKQFVEMKIWKGDNPQRWPTEKGIRKFVKGWLTRAKEYSRKKR